MGGAAGHMAHPFDLPEVNTGNDLINFFKEAAEYLTINPASVKIDGVNVSFKLIDGPHGKEFAVDRGSTKPIDIINKYVKKTSKSIASYKAFGGVDGLTKPVPEQGINIPANLEPDIFRRYAFSGVVSVEGL